MLCVNDFIVSREEQVLRHFSVRVGYACVHLRAVGKMVALHSSSAVETLQVTLVSLS